MATHTLHEERNQIYFVTITCHNWISLFELADAYKIVYKWFQYLEEKDCCKVSGYVIMPNHLHVLIYYNNPHRSINKVVGEGKRFMTYNIVKSLRKKAADPIIQKLKSEFHQEK